MHLFISVWTYFIQWAITWFWRRKWQPTPVLLPGKSHGQRSVVSYSPWGRKESDTTERLHFHFSLSCIGEGNGNPLQYSCLENPRDRGAWWAAVYGVAQSRTRLKQLSSSSSSRTWLSIIYSVCPQNCPWFGQWVFLYPLTYLPLPTAKSFFKCFHTIWPKKISQAFILFFFCPSPRISLFPLQDILDPSFQWQKILRNSDLGIPYSHCWWVFIISKSSQRTKLGNTWTYTDIFIIVSVFVYIYKTEFILVLVSPLQHLMSFSSLSPSSCL